MKPIITYKDFRGINTRVSARDLPPSALTLCENWEINNVLGKLQIGKGWSDKTNGVFTFPAGAQAIKESKWIKNNNTIISLIQQLGTLQRVDTGGTAFDKYFSTDLGAPFGLTGSFDKVFISEQKGLDIFQGGTGSGENNFPFWLGYIKRKRFWDGSAFAEEIDDYVFAEEEAIAPTSEEIASGASLGSLSADIVAEGFTLGTGGSDPFFVAGVYNVGFTFIYDGVNESTMEMDDDGVTFAERNISFTAAGTDRRVYFKLYVKGASSNLSERVTGINIYMQHNNGGWKYIRTVYVDDTRFAENVWTSVPAKWFTDYAEWENAGFGYYKYIPKINQSGGGIYEDLLYIEASEFQAASLLTDILDYDFTNKIMPNYEYSKEFRGRRYAASCLYPRMLFNTSSVLERSYDDADYLSRTVHFSPPNQLNVLPATNYIAFNEKITGLGYTSDYLLIFGLYNMAIYNEDRIFKNDFAKIGCVSHDTIVEFDGKAYWCGVNAIYAFDRFYPKDISSYQIRSMWNSISQSTKESASAAMDLINREYVVNIPTYGIFKFNIDTEEWTIKSGSLQFISDAYGGNLTGVTEGTYSIIIKYNDSYSYAGTYFKAIAKTKVSDLSLEAMVKSIVMGYCNFESNDDLILKIIVDGNIASTITLDAQTNLKNQQFGLGGINGENIQIQLELTTTLNTEKGSIDFVKLFGDVHDIQGG